MAPIATVLWFLVPWYISVTDWLTVVPGAYFSSLSVFCLMDAGYLQCLGERQNICQVRAHVSFREWKECKIRYQNLAEVSFLNHHHAGSRNWCIWKEIAIAIVYRPSKYDHKKFGGVLEKDNSISFSDFHVSVFKGERVAFHSCKHVTLPRQGKRRWKTLPVDRDGSKSERFPGHKHRYAGKIKNNLENGFRSWSCSLVLTFFLFSRKTCFALAHFDFSTLGLPRSHSPQSLWKDSWTAQRKYTQVWLLTTVTSE